MAVDFVYLASGSPRRRELLAQIGVPFQVLKIEVDETIRAGETPSSYVTRVAHAKAAAGWEISSQTAAAQAGPAPVLAADTVVVTDGRILGKPKDRRDGERMLLQLSGRTHQVLTAVALRLASGVHTRLSSSEVTFRTLDAEEVQAYWETGEPHDKAGAYAVQGRAAVFIADLRGSYSGVMGLPLFETADLLALADVPRWT
jgi:septum formation protein